MTPPARKPRLDVYVLHNDDDGDHDLFWTLATAVGARSQFRRASLDGERHAIHLHADIHRDHRIASGVLVVHDLTGVDAATRLAALHARREGVHRFILLVEARGGPLPADDVERAARGLLEDLDVDANAVPVVRAALTRRAGDTPPPMQAAMRELLAALGDLPAFLEPAPLTTTPPGFELEAAILDELRPFATPATLIDPAPATLAESAALRDGAGGSFQGGAPYLDRDEAWPLCPRCRRPMGAILQVDARDCLHAPPPAHGLFVAFTCDTAGCDGDEVRHHPLPRASRRRTADPEGRVACTDRPRLLHARERCWMLPDAEVFVAEHPDVAARLCALAGAGDELAVYARAAAAMGMDSLPVAAHFGGHHLTDVGSRAPTCDVCGERCILVVQVDAGDEQRCLWACRDHPSVAFHRIHP